VVTIPQVEAARPDSLTVLSSEVGQSAAELGDRIGRQQATLDALKARWRGSASEAAIAKAAPTMAQMLKMQDAMTRLQSALGDGGTRLTDSRTAIVQMTGQLRAQGWQIGPDGSVSVQAGSPLDRWADLGPVNAMKVRQLAAANSAALKAELARFDAADRHVAANVRDAVRGLDGAPAQFGIGGSPEAPPTWDDGSQIPVGKSPEEVNRWWTSLSDDERKTLLHNWPDKLGNLDGIPVADRSTANTAVMQRDIDRLAEVAQARGVTVEEVQAHPERYGMAGPMMDRYRNAVKVKEALAADHLKTGAPTFLQVYEPERFGGDGRAAIAIGDPDHAPNTAVVVPGTGNSVTNGWMAGDDATNLYNESKLADPGHPTAVVAWMGYDAPDALYDPRVGTTALAHEGGQLLASDVNALNATHQGQGHMTVLGHSYGSTTVADAAAGYGMHTDDVVLVGSPGTDMAHSAADFHLNEGGHLYVGAASSDPVTQLGHIPQVPVPFTDFSVSLGDDPAMDGYGSTRFKAEVPGITTPWGDHSEYYTRGGESLFSMSDIVSGHGDALQHDGMTAPHRRNVPEILATLPGVPATVDPEVFRPGTTGHAHS
jgi:hypothetical protein